MTDRKLKADILKILQENREGISRRDLARAAGANDRKCRAMIAELRAEGYIIGNSLAGGYSFGNLTDYRRTVAFLIAKSRKEEELIRTMQRNLEAQQGQVSFF